MKLGNTHPSRPTIGLLHPYENSPWYAVAHAAQARDANLLWFVGEVLRNPHGFAAQGNVLYDLVDTERLDGLIIWTGALDWFIPHAAMAAFCRRYAPLPLVSVETAIAGIPSILTDNYLGMHDAVAHLIATHGYRRIACLRGPTGHSGAQDRYRAYVETLAQHDLPLDPDLVTPPGTWAAGEGAAMLDLLLDERGVDFDALVVVNDARAFEVLAALQARGIRVPGDVAVVGFDDEIEARMITPPLTTVRQPFREVAELAVEMVLAQVRGEAAPEQVIVPTSLVVRQSCGCLSASVAQAAAQTIIERGELSPTLLATRRETILDDMVQALTQCPNKAPPARAREQAEQLLRTFLDALKDKPPGAFLATLDDILRQIAAAGENVAAWQSAILAMRRHAQPELDDCETISQVEILWHQAQVMIGETAQRTQAYWALQAERRAQTLREIGQSLITTFDIAALMGVLAHDLPRLGIPSAYLALYENAAEPTDRARLLLAYDTQRAIAGETVAEAPPYPARHLVPAGILPQDRAYSFAIEPLYFQTNPLGFMLFEIGPREGAIYATLRGEISSALEGALLLEERKRDKAALEQAYSAIEQRVAEQTIALQQESAERERLQQEIIKAQQHALQELSTPIIPILETAQGGIIVMPLIGGIDSMRARDIMRALLAGISAHDARVVILDITGVPIVDSGVAIHINKAIQAARLKGARTIITGISEAVAETIVDLGIDWSEIETLRDLQSGVQVAVGYLGNK